MRTYTRKKLQAQEIEDVHSLCRLCLGKMGKMIPIFDTNVNDIVCGLSLRISMCLGLEVSQEDAFPKLICEACNTELNKFYNFKKNCAAVYRTLKASIFTMKQNDNMNVDEVSQEQTSNTLGVVQSDKSNYRMIIDPSNNLGNNGLSQQTSINPQLREKIIQENAILDVNQIQNLTTTEQNLTKGQSFQTRNFQEQSVRRDTNTVASCSTVQSFGNYSQMGEVNHILDTEQAQEDENKEQVDNLKTTQYLPVEIVSSLIEGGVLAKREDALEIVDQSVITFTLETPSGNEVVLELVEEDPYMPADGCASSPRPQIFDSNLNSDARCCGTCGARFPGRGALARHMRVHSGERPFVCPTCGRRFAQQEVLRRHQLVHGDELPYKCPRCPKSYTQRGALQAHMRAHAPPGARSLVLHRCTRCPKMFIYPSGLSRHMNIHQGRDYPCNVCSRTFNDTSSLQRHRRAHHRPTR